MGSSISIPCTTVSNRTVDTTATTTVHVNSIRVIHPSTQNLIDMPNGGTTGTSRVLSAHNETHNSTVSLSDPNATLRPRLSVECSPHSSSEDISSGASLNSRLKHSTQSNESGDSLRNEQESAVVEAGTVPKKHLSMGDAPLVIQTKRRGGESKEMSHTTKRRSFSLLQSISNLFGAGSSAAHKTNKTVPISSDTIHGSNGTRGAVRTGSMLHDGRSQSMRTRSNIDNMDTISNVSSLRFTEQSSFASSSMLSNASSSYSQQARKRKRTKTLPPLSHFFRSNKSKHVALSPHSPSSPRSTTISQITDEELFSLTLETRHVDSAAEGRDEEGNKTINDYTILHTLGSGAFGKVKLAMDARNRPFAIKIMNKSLLGRIRQQGGGNALENVQREVAILKRLRHPNIVRLFEVIDDPQHDKLFLVMEAIENGPVLNMNEDGTSSDVLPEAKARQYLFNIVYGLEYLHSQGIVHHDIKPENLLVDGNDTVKLTDFGVSQEVGNDEDYDDDNSSQAGSTISTTEKPHFTGGTPAFSPPEIAMPNVPFDGKIADIWSLGATLFVFVFGRIPFEGSSLVEIYRNIRNQPLEIPEEPPVSHELKDLLLRMLEKDPLKRITIDQIKNHPWMLGEYSFKVPLESEINNTASNVSQKDVQNAIQQGSLKGADKMVLLVSMKRKLAQKAREIRSRNAARGVTPPTLQVESAGSSLMMEDAGPFSPPSTNDGLSQFSPVSPSSQSNMDGLEE